jgi:transcriptional regulator EpsA
MTAVANAPPEPLFMGSEALILTPQQAEAIVRVVESAPHVRRRYQFFVWTQSQLQALLPHQILSCGAYQRQQRDLVFEVFHSVVLPAELLDCLTRMQGPLLRALAAAWVEGRGLPLLLEPARLVGPGIEGAVALLQHSGIEALIVHGVSRPQRPVEIESFFVFASTGRLPPSPTAALLELMLPHLHATWQRVAAVEREMSPGTATVVARSRRVSGAGEATRGVTERERQILLWVREGKSNHQIAEVLGISPLTVKNHVQKILRKLGASNRAQAVAEALQLGVLES